MGWLRASLATVATRGKPGKCGYLNTLRTGASSEAEQMLHGAQKHVKRHSAGL